MPTVFRRGLQLTLLAALLACCLQVARSSEPRVTLHLKNVEITQVLAVLAKKLSVRLIVPAGLTGKVSVDWENVPVRQALEDLRARSPVAFNYSLGQGQLNVSLAVASTETPDGKKPTRGLDPAGQPAAPPIPNVPRPAGTTGVDKSRANVGAGYLNAAPAGSMSYAAGPSGDRDEESYRRQDGEFNTESYDNQEENPFLSPLHDPLSTFSIDVDTASYSNLRRMLKSGSRPPKGAVRLEELINYFTYDYPDPDGKTPFSVTAETAVCPWNPGHQLLSIGVQGRRMPEQELPSRNLVFLIDVSGSMQPANKLPLLKQSLMSLLETLEERDRVAIVVYAGSSGLVLDSTSGARKEVIREALSRLEAGGSTNGADGIRLAYQTAEQNFHKEGINRVILCTDGDFNVGTTSQSDLVQLIEQKRKSGVFLTVLGFGMGNYKDSTMEKLADKGNGNYAYIDSEFEARKVLVEQGGGTLVTIAKDVKLQVEFNPARVGGYRLLGYENRMLRAQDFNDDKKDAGEIGAGQCVTALYELSPPGEPLPGGKVDPLKYQQPAGGNGSEELATVKVRYKEPTAEVSQLLTFGVGGEAREFSQASSNLRFASSVAAFGMLLRESEFKGEASYDQVLRWAEASRGQDREGYRAEFLKMVQAAAGLPTASKQ